MTGRTDWSVIELHNIPLRTPLGEEIREAMREFVPSTVVTMDFSAIEKRVIEWLRA